MSPGEIVDVHAHFFPRSRVGGIGPASPELVIDEQSGVGVILLDGAVYRDVTPPLWDLRERIRVMDACGVRTQAVSPVPILLTAADEPGTQDVAVEVNDEIARHVHDSGGRLVGLGMVPTHDPDAAVHELERVVKVLGLRGIELPTVFGSRELDDKDLEPIFATAAALGTAILVHPLDTLQSIRRVDRLTTFGIGMPTDTALSATAIITSGVLARHRNLRMAFAHGCGTMPWVAPRLRVALASLRPEALANFDASVSAIWADTLVFDSEHLRLVVERFGVEHLMVGTDFPMMPDEIANARDLVLSAVQRGALRREHLNDVLSANAEQFLGLIGSEDV